MVLHPTQHTWCEHSELFWHGTASQQSSRQRVRENVVAVQEKACAARPQPDHTLRVQPHRRTSCVPCEKFMRAQRIPASYKPLSFSTGCVMGPTARARSATDVQLRSVPVHTWMPAGHILCPKRDTHANSLQHKGPVSLECGVDGRTQRSGRAKVAARPLGASLVHTILGRSHDLGGVFSNILPTFWPDTCCGVRVRCEARRGRLCAQCKELCAGLLLIRDALLHTGARYRKIDSRDISVPSTPLRLSGIG